MTGWRGGPLSVATMLAFGLGVALLPSSAPAQDRDVRVQNRLLIKQGRAFATLGPAWLERADNFMSPGLSLSLSYYLGEDDGLELRGAYLFSSLTPGAQEVLERTGMEPDAHRPVALALAGWRHTFGYGKVLLGGSVLHFDVQGAVHAGVLRTNRAFAPALSASPALFMRFGPRLHAQVDLGVMGSYEERQRGVFSVGVMPSLSIGSALW